MKKAILVATIGAMTLSVNAGDWGKAPVGKAPIIEECVDLGGEVSLGYKSDYIFRGVRLAGDSAWADVNYTFDNLAVPITVGAWYLNGINSGASAAGAGALGALGPLGIHHHDIPGAPGVGAPGAPGAAGGGGHFDQLELYVSAALGTFAGFDVALGYTHYIYPEFRSNAGAPGGLGQRGFGELGLDVRRNLGFADFVAETNYAMGGRGSVSGWYHQFGLERGFGITDSVSLVLGAGVGYTDGYFVDSGWNHYYATASLPIQLNCRTVLTPYIGYVGAPDTWIADGFVAPTVGTPQSDILHGGVTLSVSF